jgi:hypothetical protein
MKKPHKPMPKEPMKEKSPMKKGKKKTPGGY